MGVEDAANSEYMPLGVEPPDSAAQKRPRFCTASAASFAKSATAPTNSSLEVLKIRISGVGDILKAAQFADFTKAQRAAPNKEILSLVITLTGMDSSKGCILPLVTNARINDG